MAETKQSPIPTGAGFNTLAELYQYKVKAITDPVIIDTVNLQDIKNILTRIQNLMMVARGGEALNYYFPILPFPTPDWDFTLLILNGQDVVLDQQQFSHLAYIANSIATKFVEKLNLFIKQVKDTEFNHLTFYHHWRSYRTVVISYNYTLGGHPPSQGTMLDLNIYDNVNTSMRIINQQYHHPHLVGNPFHIQRKIQETDIITDDQYVQFAGDKLFPNKIETVVVDNLTGITYMAPGDLFNDTLYMIYFKMKNTSERSKIAKYAKKLSKLINLFNSVGVCQNNTCQQNTAIMMTRNTDLVDCGGNSISNSLAFKTTLLPQFQRWLELNPQLNQPLFRFFIERMTSKKLCEMLYILNL